MREEYNGSGEDAGPDPEGDLGCGGSITLYNFIRKEKISNAINNCYQVNFLFQKFLDPALGQTVN